MQLPRVTANLAISADGKISSPELRPSGWTSRDDHARLLQLRAPADALLVGRGTLERDRMTLRVPGRETQPLRCVISRRGDFAPDHPLFESPGGPVHLLVTGKPPAPHARATVHHDTLPGFLRTLATDHRVRHLHCEGGGETLRALVELDLLDELHLTLAGHTLFGGRQSPTATGIPGDFLPASRSFKLASFEPRPELGECFLSYRRCRETETQ